jgi:hypothetical protein
MVVQAKSKEVSTGTLARRSLRTLLRSGGQYTACQQVHETVAFGLRVVTAACQSVITSCRFV